MLGYVTVDTNLMSIVVMLPAKHVECSAGQLIMQYTHRSLSDLSKRIPYSQATPDPQATLIPPTLSPDILRNANPPPAEVVVPLLRSYSLYLLYEKSKRPRESRPWV